MSNKVFKIHKYGVDYPGLSSLFHQPETPKTPTGPTSGTVEAEYPYSTSTNDPDGDQVYYWFDWGDGSNSGWLGPYDSGQVVSVSHVWDTRGSYNIQVKAKDTHDLESEWSEPLITSMPKFKLMNRMLNFLTELSEIINKMISQIFPNEY
jgi:hypothetical protein